MKSIKTSRNILCAALIAAWSISAGAQVQPGSTVESLLSIARENNPEFASMRYEADAAAERIVPAGALPDPRLRTELMDITKGGLRAQRLPPTVLVRLVIP